MAAKKYRALQGDAFDAIAYREYGSEHLCHELMAANVDYMDALIFEAGVELNLPELAKPAKVAELPPWQKEGKNG